MRPVADRTDGLARKCFLQCTGCPTENFHELGLRSPDSWEAGLFLCFDFRLSGYTTRTPYLQHTRIS